MSFALRLFLLAFVLVLIDFYFYQTVKLLLKKASPEKRRWVFYCYWGFTVLSVFTIAAPFIFDNTNWPKFLKVYAFCTLLVVFISKLFGSLFIAADDLLRFLKWIRGLFTSNSPNTSTTKQPISRLQFLNYMALGTASFSLLGFLYGMIRGAFNYKIYRTRVVLPRLPSSFNGLKIVQISDLHVGSFLSTEPLEKAIEIIIQQKPDVIFFTGDLVNDRTSEITMFIDTLRKIQAPLGVFSILGNHDYGDYVKWNSKEEKDKNMQDMIQAHNEIGWKLLRNEHAVLKKGNSEIALIGVENWGGNLNFPKYGKMDKASAGTEPYPVKILLSHDPSHWNVEVINKYKNIDLTLSGHTHGFQFGIEIPGFRWSPAQYLYKQWAGLYAEGRQQIYVNRGLGFLGYAGRVGIMPEITVMELFNA